MEFRSVVARRRMVRNFDPDRPVPPEIRERLLEHAIHAPSAGFSQGWGFLVLEEAADREAFWEAATPKIEVWQSWLVNMSKAPLIIVPHSNKDIYLDRYAERDKGWTDRDEARWPVPYWDIDTGFASLLMLLTVVDEGLGACFFGIPPEQMDAYRAAFGVPSSYTAIGAIAVGYRADDGASGSPRTRTRRQVDEVVHRGRWRS